MSHERVADVHEDDGDNSDNESLDACQDSVHHVDSGDKAAEMKVSCGCLQAFR